MAAASSDPQSHQGDISSQRILWYRDQDGWLWSHIFQVQILTVPLTEGVGWIRHFISWVHFPSSFHSPWFPRLLPALCRPSLLEGEASQGFPVPRPHRQLEGKCPSHKALWGSAALGGAVAGECALEIEGRAPGPTEHSRQSPAECLQLQTGL